ncbi:MAG: DUF922 domain-containing protein [Sphingomicrobium sp.]
MFSLLIALASNAALPTLAPTPAPIATRALKDLPNVTVKYFDVAGKDGKAIEKNLKKVRTDAKTKQFSAVSSNWNVAASVKQSRTGDKCTITGVVPTFSGTVELPRLVTPDALPADVKTNFQTYVDGLDRAVASNFFFVYDRIPALVTTVTGKDCTQGAALWTGGIERIKAEALQYSAAASAAAAVPAARATPVAAAARSAPSAPSAPAAASPPSNSGY